MIRSLLASDNNPTTKNKTSKVMEFCQKIQKRMTQCGAHIRSLKELDEALLQCYEDIEHFSKRNPVASWHELPQAFRNYDILLTQLAYLSAIREYIQKGGMSRGSYLIYDKDGVLPINSLPEGFRYRIDRTDKTDRNNEVNGAVGTEGIEGIEGIDGADRAEVDGFTDKVCETRLIHNVNGWCCCHKWKKVRQIPDSEQWFETVWQDYSTGAVYQGLNDCNDYTMR